MSICAENITWKVGKKVIVNDVSLTVSRGETVGLLGPNGCGKSTLLKKLCGQDVAACGTLALGAGLIVSYVPQDASFLHGGARDYARNAGVDETMFLTLLRK